MRCFFWFFFGSFLVFWFFWFFSFFGFFFFSLLYPLEGLVRMEVIGCRQFPLAKGLDVSDVSNVGEEKLYHHRPSPPRLCMAM